MLSVFSFKIPSFTFANILHDFLSALLFFSVSHVLELQLLLAKRYCCSWQLIKNIQNSKKFKISLRQVPLSQGSFPKFKARVDKADLTVLFYRGWKALSAHVQLLSLKLWQECKNKNRHTCACLSKIVWLYVWVPVCSVQLQLSEVSDTKISLFKKK